MDTVRGWASPSSPIDPSALLQRWAGSQHAFSTAIAEVHAASVTASLELIASVLPGEQTGHVVA